MMITFTLFMFGLACLIFYAGYCYGNEIGYQEGVDWCDAQWKRKP